MWIDVVQEKRPHPYGKTKSLIGRGIHAGVLQLRLVFLMRTASLGTGVIRRRNNV